MASTARPKPVGLRLKPRLPLGLQRTDHTCLMAPINDHGNSERTTLGAAAALRDVHPPDRQGLERLGHLVHPVRQCCFGLRGEYRLAVHARRQTTGVALRHPPHAHERVGARTEHQLLQIADPCEVPSLRRREDPLPQPPYVILARRQSTWRQPKGASSGPFATTMAAASNLSSGSGISVIFLSTGSPDRVSALSGRTTRVHIRPVIRNDRLEEAANCPGFPLPFGRRRSLLGHPIPAEELGPPCGRLTGQAQGRARTSTGLPRSARVSCSRGGCPLYPGDGGALPGQVDSLTGACRSTAASPCTPLRHPIARGSA